MTQEGRKYTKEELTLLNSKKGYELLISAKKPDIEDILRRLRYEKKKKELQIELLRMQNWVVERQKRVMILFEGRELAGKGSAILEISQHLNPRNMRIVALPKPNALQKRQWYFRRYVQEFPMPGEIVFFDRSWYNRAMIEPVNGFCTRNKYNRFLSEVNPFEEMIMNDGVQLMKLYFSISKEEQERRLKSVVKNPLKKWKISSVDRNSIKFYDEYTWYKERMFEITNRNNSPWKVINANDSYSARIEAMEYILSQAIYR